MTRKERSEIRQALHEVLSDEGDFSHGIAILARLCGMDYPAYRVSQGAKAVKVSEIAAGPNRRFNIAIKEQRNAK